MPGHKKGKQPPKGRITIWLEKFNAFCGRWKKSVIGVALATVIGIYVIAAKVWNASKEFGIVPNPSSNTSSDSLTNTNEPKWFSRNDINKESEDTFRLLLAEPQALLLTDGTDKQHIRFDYSSSSLVLNPPSIYVSISGDWGGSHIDPEAYIVPVDLKKGCGFRTSIPNYDIVFEIVDVEIPTARAIIAVFRNPQNEMDLATMTDCL